MKALEIVCFVQKRKEKRRGKKITFMKRNKIDFVDVRKIIFISYIEFEFCANFGTQEKIL